MKLISLNIWGGKVYKPLIHFIKKYSQDTDIFCFQEVYDTNSNVKQYKGTIRTNLLEELKKILNNFQVFYDIEIAGFDDDADPVSFNLTVGKAVFIRKNIHINTTGKLLLYGNRSEKFLKKDFSNLPVTLQYVSFEINNKQFTVCNTHGISFPGDKLDTSLRIAHSRKIKEFMNKGQGSKILTGDFNLLPETESIRILGEGIINLIKEYHIEKTRSNLSPFYGRSDFQKFADYIFVTNDVLIKNFQVPDVTISDHLPMILEFS